MKTLCKYLGGSHLYKLNTPQSDVDERGVFMHTDPLYVFGVHTKDNVVKQNDEVDVALHELAQFVKLACKSNTQTLECLWAPRDAFTELDPLFESLVLARRTRFVSSKHLFNSLEGYLHNERRLALGERKGKLGGKRKDTLDKLGFSYKNFVHLFRLASCGAHFFETGTFHVSMLDFNPMLHEYCMELKTDPERFDVTLLVEKADELQDQMRNSYAHAKFMYEPDYDYVATALKELYRSVLV